MVSQKILADSDCGSLLLDVLEEFERRPSEVVQAGGTRRLPRILSGGKNRRCRKEAQLEFCSYSSHILTSLNKHVRLLVLL